jgi:tetratricopeptide (TPR) repeat protein
VFAHLAEKLGAYDRARAAYQSAIVEGGGEVEAREHLAEIHEKAGHYDLAAGVLADALKVFPGDAGLKVRLGEVQLRQSNYGAAEATLSEALRAPGSHRARAHYLLAFVQYHKGSTPAALKELDDALALAPDMPEAYYQRGEIYAATGRTELARQSYARAVQLRATYTEAILGLKRLDEKTGP